jgi:hypothetical protein
MAPSTFKSLNGSVVLQRKGMEIAMFLSIVTGKCSNGYWTDAGH